MVFLPLLVLASFFVFATPQRQPIILFPDFAGSEIQVKFQNRETKHWWCVSSSTWYSLWLDENQNIPFVNECWKDNFLSNDPKIQTRTSSPFDAESVAFDSRFRITPIWDSFLEKAKSYGYINGESIFAANYDWRQDPSTLGDEYIHFRHLVEYAFEINQNQKVWLLSLGYGSPVVSKFLENQTQEWKNKFIHGWYSLSGTFGGSLDALRHILQIESGFSFGLRSMRLRQMVQSSFAYLPSTRFLLPNSLGYNVDSIVTLSDPNDNSHSTAQSVSQVLYQFYKSTPISVSYKDPGVPMWCSRGSNIKTASSLVYLKSNPPQLGLEPQSEVLIDGDSIASTQSLSVCDSWKNSTPVIWKDLYHSFDLIYSEPLEHLFSILLGH